MGHRKESVDPPRATENDGWVGSINMSSPVCLEDQVAIKCLLKHRFMGELDMYVKVLSIHTASWQVDG